MRPECVQRFAGAPIKSSHQMLFPNQPDCTCRAARKDCGAVYLFAILAWYCSLGSRFFGLDGCGCLALDGCICANAFRSFALTETSVAAAGGGMLASSLAICEGMIVA